MAFKYQINSYFEPIYHQEKFQWWNGKRIIDQDEGQNNQVGWICLQTALLISTLIKFIFSNVLIPPASIKTFRKQTKSSDTFFRKCAKKLGENFVSKKNFIAKPKMEDSINMHYITNISFMKSLIFDDYLIMIWKEWYKDTTCILFCIKEPKL
jgi:hypothetical protein